MRDINRVKNIVIMFTTAVILIGCNSGVSFNDLKDHNYQQEKLSEVKDGVYDKASDIYENAQTEAGQATDNLKNTASDKASEAADRARDIAERQAGEAMAEKDQLSQGLSKEWKNLLEKLQTPTGISESFSDDNTGGTTEYGDQNTYTDETVDYGETYNNGESENNDTSKATGSTSPVIKNNGIIEPPEFNISEIGEYAGQTVVAVNNNHPYFKDTDYTTAPFEEYSELDGLGRCGTAYANVCKETMPTADRGDIGMIKPTGWKQKKYEGIIDENPPYLYNRAHLIAFCLSGENANPKNLITGTRHMNIETGMEKYELDVQSYVKKTGNHVLYRVTPVFEGSNLLATGVLMEGSSVEDDGISYCVFVYNVQPGIIIDYATGESRAA